MQVCEDIAIWENKVFRDRPRFGEHLSGQVTMAPCRSTGRLGKEMGVTLKGGCDLVDQVVAAGFLQQPRIDFGACKFSSFALHAANIAVEIIPSAPADSAL